MSFAGDFEQLQGLRPKLWICVGSGYAREDVKALLLSRGIAFTGDAVTTLTELAARVTRTPSDRVLGPLSRQEVLRALLAEPRINAHMPELKRLRRQSTFLRRLDLSIQAGRMAFAHEAEEQVLLERLEQRFPGALADPVRAEVRALARAYEAWLEARGCRDLPMLLRRAAEVLSNEGGSARPEGIRYFRVPRPESLERAFWEAIQAAGVRCEVVDAAPDPRTGSQVEWRWERWHTLDDAAEAMAERIAAELLANPEARAEDHAVLIPETNEARRTLRRALANYGIPYADPRDPTRLRFDEGLKRAMLPLEVLGTNFERSRVIAWLGARENPEWTTEIRERGIRDGLGSYAGGRLAGAHAKLRALAGALSGRRTIDELGQAHLEAIRELRESDCAWVVPFFEQVWAQFGSDMRLIGAEQRRAPLRYWLERLRARVAETPAPVEKEKPDSGVRLYRLQQAPLLVSPQVWILGMPSAWLVGEGAGDAWFSERERETLSGEFGVRSAIEVGQERRRALQAWIAQSRRVTVLDAEYGYDGRERESVLPVLRELGAPYEEDAHAESRGGHPRWAASFSALRPEPPRAVALSPLESREISASALDAYSRCGFLALAWNRWGLQEQQEPDAELWPQVRGLLLHEAVRLLVESRDEQGNFTLSSTEALERAWQIRPPRGLLRGDRIERYVKSRLLPILDKFRAKEIDYARKSGARPVVLDEREFKLELEGGLVVRGKPDRVDENGHGLFVIDYKSGGSLPNGTEMVESGYRLQLPFYALAASRALAKPVVGLQFVELNRKATRSSGIFFKEYNGKEPGKFTQVRSNSRSLIAGAPEQTWSRLAESIQAHAEGWVAGRFEARPKRRDKECDSCFVSDLCGLRRRVADPGEAAEAGETAESGEESPPS